MIQTYLVVLDTEKRNDIVAVVYTLAELLDLMATRDVVDAYSLDIEDNGSQHETIITGKVFLTRIYTRI